MYIPPAFQIDDPAQLAAFIRRHSFATLITQENGVPFASHVPMLFRPDAGPHGTLVSHLARANPQWQHFASGQEVLAIFHGPHSYISPTWYATTPAVPTWNYAAVHAYGLPVIFGDHDRVAALLQETIATYEAGEPQPWSGELPEEYRDKMMRGIVAFEMPLTRLEGKFKLGQNRTAEDVCKLHGVLSQSHDADQRALARMLGEQCGLGVEVG